MPFIMIDNSLNEVSDLVDGIIGLSGNGYLGNDFLKNLFEQNNVIDHSFSVQFEE